uniref:Uncharacterized protein n=1 Tax=Rhizophora mucronata TaxID=61149 RepID=A0A2P2QPM5_RHIMU
MSIVLCLWEGMMFTLLRIKRVPTNQKSSFLNQGEEWKLTNNTPHQHTFWLSTKVEGNYAILIHM